MTLERTSSMGPLYVVVRRETTLELVHEIDGDAIVIGRQDDCGLRLPHSCVSRKHALIFRQESQVLIRDLASRNGTLLDGRTIKRDVPLRQRDEIVIGPFRLTVFFNLDGVMTATSIGEVSTFSAEQMGASTVIPEQVARRLTEAQTRVYRLLLEGLLEKEVAARLHISPNTVHDHAKAIYKALSVSTRGELISRWATDRLQRPAESTE